MADKKELDLSKISEKSIDVASPKAMATFASQLKQFITDNSLFTEIKEKKFVHVEGWQFAGAAMGIFPRVKTLERLVTDAKEVAYRSEVELVQLSTGAIVGYGIATCSNQESKKKSFDEYAIASMAQTRAVGKAFRLSIGWIMKLANYEATPAEEASEKYGDSDVNSEDTASAMDLSIDDIKMLVDIKLTQMASPDKMRFVKNAINTVKMEKFTDDQYKKLFEAMNEARKNEGI